MAAVLVVGSRNAKKLGEIREILGDLDLDLRDLSGWPDAPEVVEDGDTFEANARKKAVEMARHLDRWVLGEDSGLVVPALGGRPGVYSARFAGTHGDDAANNALLLSELRTTPEADRGAVRPARRRPRSGRGPLQRRHPPKPARRRRLRLRPFVRNFRVSSDLRRVERPSQTRIKPSRSGPRQITADDSQAHCFTD
jgi:hypothetical protein